MLIAIAFTPLAFWALGLKCTKSTWYTTSDLWISINIISKWWEKGLTLINWVFSEIRSLFKINWIFSINKSNYIIFHIILWGSKVNTQNCFLSLLFSSRACWHSTDKQQDSFERCLTLCLLTWFPCLIETSFLARKAMGHAIFHFSLYIIKDWIIDTHEQSIQHLFLSKEKTQSLLH